MGSMVSVLLLLLRSVAHYSKRLVRIRGLFWAEQHYLDYAGNSALGDRVSARKCLSSLSGWEPLTQQIPHIPCRLPRTPASPSQLTRNSHLYTQVLAFVCIPQSGVAGSLNDYTLFRWLIAGKGGLVGHPGKTLRFPQGAGWWADIGGF